MFAQAYYNALRTVLLAFGVPEPDIPRVALAVARAIREELGRPLPPPE